MCYKPGRGKTHHPPKKTHSRNLGRWDPPDGPRSGHRASQGALPSLPSTPRAIRGVIGHVPQTPRQHKSAPRATDVTSSRAFPASAALVT
eukprot:1816701-Pyramimonas_sp.AAC.1